MFLRTAVVAGAGETRRRVGEALHHVESLVTHLDSVDQLRRQLGERPFDLVVLERAHVPDLSPALVEELRSGVDGPEVMVLGLEDDAGGRAAYFAAGCFAVLPTRVSDEVFGESFRTLAERRLREARHRLREIPDEDYRLSDYATTSPAMRQFLKETRRVAARDATVLLLGETGVGKGLLARSLHNEGPRAKRPFVTVSCAALNENLLETELFGHVKGAFTGAERTRRGYFELAHRGTLFLDEIAELPTHLQAKLLSVIEDRTLQPLGAEKSISIDVRLIAATNRDLASEVENRRFREDLYYRLNGITLTLPALRDRVEDIPEIAQSYVEHYRALTASDVKGISSDAFRTLTTYAWPGNIRELSNAIERAVIMATGAEIQVEDLPVAIQEFAPTLLAPHEASGLPEAEAEWLRLPWAGVRRKVLEETELRYLKGLLTRTGGRVGEAARQAGMDPRSLHPKLKKHGLRKEDYR
jgi:DNA-binding NtrC family response regulator